MKFKLQSITLLTLFMFFQLDAQPAFADPNLEANQLLQFFSASCPSQGQWTQAALRYTNNLVQAIKSLENDPDCRALSGSVPEIQNLSDQITFMSQDTNQRQILSLQAQQQALLSMINKTSDPTQLATLLPELQTVNVQLAQYQGLKFADDQYTQQQMKGRALQTLVNGTNSILQQATQNATCLSNHQNLLPALVGLSGSIGAIALTGGTSLIVAAGAQIFNNVINNVRTQKIAKRINKMASAITASALQCVLESLSNQWCASQDAREIIKIKATALAKNTPPTPFENGIILLDEDFPLFLDWLKKIPSGTSPTNEAMAARQNTVIDSDRFVKVALRNALGIIGQKMELFNRIKDPEEQWTIELTIIDQITRAFTTVTCASLPCSNSPLAEIFAGAEKVGPWFLVGVDVNLIPKDSLSNRRSLFSFSLSELRSSSAGIPNFIPDLNTLKKYMYEWQNRASSRVNTESRTTNNLDPLLLISDGATINDLNAKSNDLNLKSNKLSPKSSYRSLKKIIFFLENQNPDLGSATGSFKNIYNDTLTRLRNIAERIEKVVQSNKKMSKEDGDQIITEIFKEAVLDNGIGFIGDRLHWALKIAVNDLISNDHSGLTPSQATILRATNDIIGQLEAFAPGATLNAEILNTIGRDIEKSQSILQSSLNEFTNQFGDAIENVIKGFEIQAAILNEDLNGVNNKEISEICLKLLAAPKWPSAVNQNHCIGRSLTSIYDNADTNSPQVSALLIRTDYNKRVCHFRDYNRKNQFYQYFNSNH